MTRYYLLFSDRGNFPFNLALHHFHKSDVGDLHDHPWAFVSYLAEGAYLEHRLYSRKVYLAGSFNFKRARDFHKVELLTTDCWSLVLFGPRTREWGFLTRAGWEEHVAYHGAA